MKKYDSSEFADRQSETRRTGKPFLMKPAYEANSFMCMEYNFDKTFECPRVVRLQDYLCGIEELSGNELQQLLGNQPVFYFQERFGEGENRYEWNGFILFRTTDQQLARLVARERAQELNIALAFSSPLDNKYYMLVKTDATCFNERKHRHYCFKHKALLLKYLPKVQWMPTDFFVRAFAQDHYDVVNKDMLFGEPVDICPAAVDDDQRCCKTMTAGEVLKSFFSHLFRQQS